MRTLATFLSLSVASVAAAQPEPVDYTITVDPLTTALGYVHLQVERTLSSHTSLYVGPHLRLFDGVLADAPEPYVGLGAEAGFRYFPWGAAPRGPWAMVRSVGAHLHTTDGSKQQSFGGYSSLLLGGTATVGPLVLSGGAGLNYLYYTVGDYGPSGPYPALHTNLGIAL
jgi:hypothetical protein